MSEEREAFRKWCEQPKIIGDVAEAAWFAALEWQAARQSAGATGQEPIYQTRWAIPENVWGDVPKDAYDDYKSFGYAARRIVYAAPIVDNGAKACYQCKGCGDNDAAPGHCVRCNGTGVEPTSQPAESKQPTYCDIHCKMVCQKSIHGYCRRAPQSAENLQTELTDEEIRAGLRRAQAKGK